MPVDANSRIQILDVPIALPATCVLCGSGGGDGRRFLDFGFQLDMYGAVIFCTFCMESFAEALDYVPKFNLDIAEERIEELNNQYGNKLVENQALRNALVAVLTSNFDRNIDVDELLSVLLASVEKQSEDNSKSDGSEPTSDEASSKQGSKRVSAARKKSDPDF